MKRIWPYIYLALIAASFLGGTGLFGIDYGHTNVDWVFVIVSLLLGMVFPSMAVSYARTQTTNHLLRSSLFRGFIGGCWTDPLQCLLLTTLLLCGWFLGSLFTLLHADHQGIMLVLWKGAMALGFVVGGAVARNRSRASIT